MSPAGLLFALGAARVCAPSRPWRLDGRVVTDDAVRVRACAFEGAPLWLVQHRGGARLVDVGGLLSTLARLEGGEATSSRRG